MSPVELHDEAPEAVQSGNVVSVENLCGGYGQLQVLRDINLNLPEGSVCALLGRNGVGKTTFLRTVAGLLRPQSGRIRISNTDVTSSGSQVRPALGLCFIPEGRAVFRNLTVVENITLFAPTGMKDAHERVYSIFPRLGERRKHLASQMSGGEQQMLALARAFLVDPQAVLIDEPSFGLAPKAIDIVFEALTSLAKQGTAILLVEQYIERALDLADDVYVMDRGELSFAGAARNLTAEQITSQYFGVNGNGA